MAHALAAFIRERTDEKGWRNADLVRESGLSRQVVSKYLSDKRERINRLPDRGTLEGFAKAFNVSLEFLIGKAIESLGLGYSSGDFVNSVATATDRELLAEIGERLAKRGEERADSSAANTDGDLEDDGAQVVEFEPSKRDALTKMQQEAAFSTDTKE